MFLISFAQKRCLLVLSIFEIPIYGPQRDLTVKGRMVFAKTLGLSKFWHIDKIFIPPNSIISKIKKIFVNFVWHGKAHLVNYEVCPLPLKQGGLDLPNFNTKITALHLSCLKEFSDDIFLDWNFMFRYFLGQHLRNIIPLPFFQGNRHILFFNS